MHKVISHTLVLIFTSIAAILPVKPFTGRLAVSKVHALSPLVQASQTDQFFKEEALIVYKTNLERRAVGLPPLRWNRELSIAARHFAVDTVENRPGGYCGHEDSFGRSPVDRMVAAGYTAALYVAENVFCSASTPQEAVDAWMNSEAHRNNLLSPDAREIGPGYYKNDAGRGYVVQNFARDQVFAPVIINDEALSTTDPEVTLYIYDRIPVDGFMGLGAAEEMMIANDAAFTDAVWEPFVPEKKWALQPGPGWRTVYVKLRDKNSRITISSDTIYLGAKEDALPAWEHASTVTGNVSAEDMHTQFANATTWTDVQFGLNWMLDDSDSAFEMVQGSGQSVPDAGATGGTTFIMPGSPTDVAYAWFWSGWPVVDQPMVAYIRVKASNNTSADTIFEFSLNDGSKTYGPLKLRGTDFTKPNQYQEFALPFSVTPGAEPNSSGSLAINLFRMSTVDVSVDSVTFFTAAQPMNDALHWTLPHASQRSRGLLTRAKSNGSAFSTPMDTYYYPGEIEDTLVLPPVTQPAEDDPAEDVEATELIVSDSELKFDLFEDESASAKTTASITCENCPGSNWWATSSEDWLTAQRNGDHVDISVSAAGLMPGNYEGIVTLTAADEANMDSTHIRTILTVKTAEDEPAVVFLPLVTK